jgi:hypothetical protein
MPERITAVPLDEGFEGLLKAEALRRGVEPSALAAELIQEELKRRTAPRAPRGTVTPFRR